jgi:hypothetical protein
MNEAMSPVQVHVQSDESSAPPLANTIVQVAVLFLIIYVLFTQAGQ